LRFANPLQAARQKGLRLLFHRHEVDQRKQRLALCPSLVRQLHQPLEVPENRKTLARWTVLMHNL
jgi:hypothetical protein